jgi:hypothetical protein
VFKPSPLLGVTLALAIGGASCGGGASPSPTAPTIPSLTTTAAITFTTLMASAQRTVTGITYAANFKIQETARVGATISGIDFVLNDTGGQFGDGHADNPMLGTSHIGPGASSVRSRFHSIRMVMPGSRPASMPR